MAKVRPILFTRVRPVLCFGWRPARGLECGGFGLSRGVGPSLPMQWC
jgi:hypothetical protein